MRFISGQAARVKDSCDGKNVDAVLTELGERLHRTVLEHLLQFQYNTTGASRPAGGVTPGGLNGVRM